MSLEHKTILACEDEDFAPVRQLVIDMESLPSATTPALRKQVLERGREWGLGLVPDDDGLLLSESMRKYADKCARFAYKVYDAEVEALKQEGYTEDEIVDVTLAASFGVSLARLERGLMLLEGEDE